MKTTLVDIYLPELFELLSIPTISAQKEHKKDMKLACKWLTKKLRKLGFKADILATSGHPVVYAENLKAGAKKPIILVYGHYDVQSPDPLEQWVSDPFKPEIRSGNIYGRGTADDKGQFYTWIAAIQEILKKDKKLPVNIKFLLEGEEEVGSKNLDEFVNQNTSLLKADICAISDGHNISESQPVITYGLRGIVYYDVRLKSLAKDVHSGTYGGNVLNPVTVLAQIVSKLKNENHKVLIPGFYDDVRKLTKKEVFDLSKFPFREKEILKETGAKVVAGESGHIVQVRGGARPTLDVNGIWGGYQAEGPKTIIPADAGAKISIRLVPYQTAIDIAKKFEKFIKSLVPEGIDLTLELLSDGEPIIVDKESKYFKAAEYAYKKIFGKKPLYELSGGSVPITATFKNGVNMDSILMGYGLPDDGLHSPNEKLSLSMFEKGIQTNIKFLKSL